MGKIGVAMSGGGHRASLFGLGVLLYLADSGRNRDVCSVASVSGGSLTNGYVGRHCEYRACSADEFEGCIRPLARRLAQQGTLWAWPGTWLYLTATILALAAVCLVWCLPWHPALRLLVFVGGLAVWSKLLSEQRGRVCAQAFAATLFSGESHAAPLSAIARPGIDHVVCATDLHSGEHVYFSGNFVCSYRFGWGEPGDLSLARAVQASAAFPGGFPVSWLRAGRHRFQAGPNSDAPYMALIDGGVYDNMAEQWPVGVRERKRRPGWEQLASGLQEPDEVIVVNSSANLPWSPVRRLWLPLVGELFTLKRAVDVLYDNTTAPRRRALYRDFDRAEREGRGLRGALVMIEQTPDHVARVYAGHEQEWPDRAARAAAVLKRLERDPAADEWRRLVEENTRVPTTLRRLGTEASARLIRHGYVLAMANLHVILGYPLLDLPPTSRFEALVS